MPQRTTGSGRRQATTPAGTTRPGADRPHSSVRDVTLVVVVVLALLGATLAYVVLRDPGSEDVPSAGGTAALAHVHGLDVDPAGDTLVAGSHHGLFRVPADGRVRRIGGHVQDVMGFTVVGPGHYLASGHPGEGQSGPSSVGLVESTDGGRTWRSLSLSGEADFHALEAAHGQVYGFDSLTGSFMVSRDKRHWETRARLPMVDFAVSPENPDVVVATTEQGPARSDDGGRTFRVLRGAPLLLLLSWADDGTLVGVAPDGAVQASENAGRTWQPRGQLAGAPEALEATGDGEVFAAAGGKVLASTDGGRTFRPRPAR